jgi:hypothetical protein
MTKPCKSCKEQIDQAATKCPKCQGYQHWYRNPQAISLFLLLPCFAFIFWNASRLTNRASFADYKDKLSVSVVDEKPSAGGKAELLTVRVENRTNRTWKRPTFQIENLDENDKVLSVEHISGYNMVVAPNSSQLDTLSLRISPAQPVAKRRVTLTDIDPDRY